MIIKEAVYTIECDRCEAKLEWETRVPRWYNTEKEAIDAAKSYGFFFGENGCLCAECVTEVNRNIKL